MLTKNLKLKKISSAVALALIAFAIESNADVTNSTPYSSASTGIGADTTNTSDLRTPVTPAVISTTGSPLPIFDYNYYGAGTQTNTGLTSTSLGTTNSNINIINSSTVSVTGGNNTGIILRGNDSELHVSQALGYAEGSGDVAALVTSATSVANSTANTNLNHISNLLGTITASTGIGLSSITSASSDATARSKIGRAHV